MASSRWLLRLKVILLRLVSSLVAFVFRFAGPKPPTSSFKRSIPSTISATPGTIDLIYYTPKDYHTTKSVRRYPVVLNFHGGGFVVGTPTDDARWAQLVMEECDAVVVSVAYRLAPEYPFPIAVEDGTDAMLYLQQHHDELGIDPRQIATSGFSAGGNLAITVPLRWREEMRRRQLTAGAATRSANEHPFCAIVAWYPSTDFTVSRDERRASCVRPEKTLPKAATDVFDESYLYPSNIDTRNPYLSPGVAPDDVLMGLPNDIILYTCEWDMLQAEAERFKDRCQDALAKQVRFRMVEQVVHAWDKGFRSHMDPEVRKYYREACADLSSIFGSIA